MNKAKQIEASITIVLCAYNQEKYIEKAVKSALSQEGPPIEIILSDDASQDSTYDIMAKIVSQYRGYHQVILRRNMNNLGLTAHFQAAVNQSTGSWIVALAGDDVCKPNRARVTAQIAKDNPEASAIAVGYQVINSSGEIISDNCLVKSPTKSGESVYDSLVALRRWRPRRVLTGAVMSWRRDLFTCYSPLPAIHGLHEDAILQWRAMSMGKIICVDSVIMQYRKHDAAHTNLPKGLSRKELSRRMDKIYEGAILSWGIVKDNFEEAGRNGILSQNTSNACVKEVELQIRYVKAVKEWGSVGFIKRVWYLVRYCRYGIWKLALTDLSQMIPRS